jgi:hypothetical protein
MLWRALRCFSPLSRNAGTAWLLFASISCSFAQAGGVTPRSFEQNVRPLVKQYCFKCHSTEKQKGDLDLERYTSLNAVLKHPEPWGRVFEQLSMDEMPPKDKPQPTSKERARLVAWVNNALDKAALRQAGDPGPVVLRRLNNAEYTYTVRDLTGVESLDPAMEFPADSAAGEGFMNTGNTLVMSPPLITKYLDAGKAIARHAVLLPDGIRFSAKTTRRDWTDEILARIRAFYDTFTEAGGEDFVTQQGIALDRSKGGCLPLDKYLAASLELRDGRKNVAVVARERGLSPKYLGLLVNLLNGNQPSPFLDGLRARWRVAMPGNVPALTAEIAQWQKALWKFNSVGYIGRAGGPKSWMEPVSPLVERHELRVKLAAPANGDDVVFFLAAGDAGDGREGDFVVWQQPKLILPGHPPILLRDVRNFVAELMARRDRILTSTARALAAAAEACAAKGGVDAAALAQRHGLDTGAMEAWFHYLGLGFGSEMKLGVFTNAEVIPSNSLLARWRATEPAGEKQQLAEAVERMLTSASPPAGSPNAALYGQLTSLAGPLFSAFTPDKSPAKEPASSKWGLDPALFGKRPDGSAVDAADLSVQAPSVIEVRLPASVAVGGEFVTTGVLDPTMGAEGSVQMQVLTTRPNLQSGSLVDGVPIVVNEGSAARKRIEAAFVEFRQTFPAALCYTKIVPVDEVVTLTLFYREDEPLARLLLDDAQKAKLDRMWDELQFISQDALTLVDAFEQLWQFSTQDGPDAPHGDKRLEPLREPINQRAAAFRQRLLDTQPRHVEAVLEFAERAYRRPLTEAEKGGLRGLYQQLRQQEIAHGEAIRLVLARVFVAPAFLYRLENASAGLKPGPVSDWELANRLSYFLWSSAPDDELRALAGNGKLHKPEVLAAQTRRMLRDARVRRLATEFACQWLHIHDFDSLDEKSERHFPTFASLRGPMYEEAIRFFIDSFQNDASVLALFDTDHTFLNESLAQHYGIPGVTGAEWRRVDGVKQYGRGGILGLSATLAQQSGASRTSPILRGDWVSEVLLGEKIPRPPKDVPLLPEDETTETLTVRQLTEKHINDPRCAGCHARFDGFGYALEGYDAIGRARAIDLGGRTIDTHAVLFDGTSVSGAQDLRRYLLTKRRDAVVQQFCRKLLGYALGRSVMLSDRPLLAEMQTQLRKNDSRFSAAVETIVRSKQFLEIRGRDAIVEE